MSRINCQGLIQLVQLDRCLFVVKVCCQCVPDSCKICVEVICNVCIVSEGYTIRCNKCIRNCSFSVFVFQYLAYCFPCFSPLFLCTSNLSLK